MRIRTPRGEMEVRETLADRVVGYFNPRAGLERLKARTTLMLAGGGYQAGRRDRRGIRNWRPREQSANADILPDLPDLRGRSRDLVRNNPIAGGAIATSVTNVVGDGLVLQAQIDREVLGLSEEAAENWQRAAEREWELFCGTCDFTSHQSCYELQALAFRSVLESGDLLVVRRFREEVGAAHGTKVQFVEAERVCNDNRSPDTTGRIAGVQHDADGRATGFQVASRHPDDVTSVSGALTWTTVAAFDAATGRRIAFLLFDRLRPDQARGVPYLAPVIETLKEMGSYTEHEARAAMIAAMFTVFETSPELTDAPQAIGSDASEAGVETGKEIALEDAGAIVSLDPGHKIEIANPTRPNTAFDAFIQALTLQVGAGLGIPREVLLKEFTASYSASRAALETAWQFFRHRRSWLAWNFCQPLYAWAIEESVARGRLSAPGFFDDPLKREAWLGAEWIGPARINLDPAKEAEANKTDLLELRTTTRKQIAAERTGGNWRRTIEQLQREEAALGSLAAQPATAAPPQSAARNTTNGAANAADIPEGTDQA